MTKRTDGQFARSKFDHYATPPEALKPVLPHLRRTGITQFCEPCRGAGALLRQLEGHGFICAGHSDVSEGVDARSIKPYAAPVITNPPYERKMMHSLIDHWIGAASQSWLLLEWDWLATGQARRYLLHASDVVIVGRLQWIANSASAGFDNYCWVRFSADHQEGPRLHNGIPPTPENWFRAED